MLNHRNQPDAGSTIPEAAAVNPAERESERGELAGSPYSWRILLLYGATLILALSLRLLYLGSKSLDEDEILSVLMARWNWRTFWWMASHMEANMVLYFGTLRFWIRLGESESAIRSFSVIVGLATVMAVAWLGTRTFGRRIGLFGALLLAINGFHIEYSQYARSYTLLVFLVTLSSFFFLQSVREGSWKNWILYVVTSTLAIYAHIFAVFVLIAHWVSLSFVPRGQAPWRRLLPAAAAIVLLALPLELFMLFRKSTQLDWVSTMSWQGIFSLFASLAGVPDQSALPGYGTWALLLLYSIPLIIGVLTLVKARARSMDAGDTWYGAFFLSWLLVPILLTLAISLRKPMFVNRYLIICLPPFILLAAYGCSQIRRAWLLVPLFCAIASLSVPELLSYYQQPSQDWRGLARYVLSNEKPGDAALFCPPYYGLRMTHYLKRKPYLDHAAGIQSDAYRYSLDSHQAAFETEQESLASASHLPLLVPEDDASYAPLLQNLSSRYARVWLIERQEEGAPAAFLRKRLIETTLAGEFPGVPNEKLFSGGLQLVLYEKPER